MYSKTIIDTSFPKAWERAVEFIKKSNHRITFGGGLEVKHAVDSSVTVILDNNAINDALKHIVHPSDSFCTDRYGNPSEDRICAYIKEYDKDFDYTKFVYTYYGEMVNGKTNLINKLKDGLMFQIESTYTDKNGNIIKGLPSNRNVVTLLNNERWGMLDSLPCWNILWIRLERIDEDGTVWVSVSTWYRSHDVTDAWESNFIAQVTMVVRDILEPLNAKILSWTEGNASLHIYEHNLDIKLKNIPRNPMLQRLQDKYDSRGD